MSIIGASKNINSFHIMKLRKTKIKFLLSEKNKVFIFFNNFPKTLIFSESKNFIICSS